MLNALSAAVFGFLLGLKHATDADHVVAVTTIVARERSFARAARIGALWGLGHSLTVFVIGGLLIVFRISLPARVGLGLEFGVALMLIVLGFASLRGDATVAADRDARMARGAWRPVIIGVVHGLAGSAAVALLVLALIPDTVTALAYLLVFSVGTIAGMIVVTSLIAAPAVYGGDRVTRFQRGIRVAAGTLSLLLGLVLAREIVVDGGLFRPMPSWSPR
ncbi:MAG: high-affinity nickel-transport family protein [Gemmatimonadetes bacterium]|nr:high-affinity nickel-transport family protein [Gemmatimonadota bacterium]